MFGPCMLDDEMRYTLFMQKVHFMINPSIYDVHDLVL